jgi:hypothetical protein
MEDYLAEFQYSTLPLPFWGVVALWLCIFTASHLLFLRTRTLVRGQTIVKTGNPQIVARGARPGIVLARLVFGGAVFSCAYFLEGPFAVFLAGGWTLASCASLASNIQGMLYIRALTRPGAAEGTLSLSNPLVIREVAFYFFGLAVFCLIAGLLTAHLALLGGAVYIAASGFGYLRKAPKQ